MEGSSRRRSPALSVQREFAGSRLEEQIVRQAFELVVPNHRLEEVEAEPSTHKAGRPPVNATRSQGA